MAKNNHFQNKKQFILDMFPYPSGAGLHVGHVESYTATDILARYLKMNGRKVLHPQGFDAFGLPAENYAIKTGVHPQETTKKAIKTFKKQLAMMNFDYDWDREINSSDPGYYRWTQWFFLLLYKNGLAYRKKAKVNWCQNCQTVLANEQAENGRCERCEGKVIQKDLEQWFFKITDFIESRKKTKGLIEGLKNIDWPQSTKQAQLNWIGKSEGAIIKFPISNFQFLNKPKNPNNKKHLEVFTTRIDTIFGCTYCVLAPEHEILDELKDQIKNWGEVQNYINQARNKTDLNRLEAKEKTGVKLTGVEVTSPFNQEKLPLFVADYVLSHYGTGAVMAVPAHDERDFEFAQKYNLPIKTVIVRGKTQNSRLRKGFSGQVKLKTQNHKTKLKTVSGDIFTDYGILANSGEYNGLRSEEAKEKMTNWLEKEKLGGRKTNYKLRDWLVSRQRYWGAPIPIIYCDKCGVVPVPESDLPVKLPDDVDFLPTGESPLKYSKSFQNVKCPACGGPARRESDTMDTFVCSSWYYLRYADPRNDQEFAAKDKLKKWLPVDLYVGGAEHTVLHLLYARFFTKALHYLGYLNFDEPFSMLRHQGVILAEDGTKMSKSKGNIINPDDVVKEYGADALRMYEMFMGPLEDAKPWNTKGIVGIRRFLEKMSNFIISNYHYIRTKTEGVFSPNQDKIIIALNKTIKKVSEDIKFLKFNTAISQLMILGNTLRREPEANDKRGPHFGGTVSYFKDLKNLKFIVILLAPFAPHLAEELWGKLEHKSSIFKEKWPDHDENLIKEEKIEIPIMVNGKMRDTLEVDPEISEENIKKLALESNKIQKWLNGGEPKKFIYVKGRVINIVL
ncbi:MAG: leucine--tRNA ligase [Candidatus Portnoybacteria bacterium CG10_big_fil_rev_8_21_14_0_10_44_7]|uniref:Leucine--tRNA ligase n=1 Tax=Candidatus Portnoybacteria bacterium CG10_big_fil_rev_8_21_14_0_10_44_7 TaxID=1974816 RepID=A0A2M8KJ68_9BACT|nr:MAG: leucine--tRNA ligase [Candidatus Portnoybacteria bacterium CG10_big_fil_rev_8_21_14_0_10_44_7]